VLNAPKGQKRKKKKGLYRTFKQILDKAAAIK